MMTVGTTCLCGMWVEMQPADVRLVTCSHGARFVYRCPACKQHVDREANAQQVAMLRAAKVRELVVTEEQGEGPPISEDELIAFGLALEATPSAART